MKFTIATALLAACMTLMFETAAAQSVQPAASATKDGTQQEAPVSLKECMDHVAVSKISGSTAQPAAGPKDAATMKKDAACAEMMKEGKGGKHPATK